MEVCGRLLRGEVVCGGVDVRLRLRLTPRGCGVRGVSGLGWGPARFSEPGVSARCRCGQRSPELGWLPCLRRALQVCGGGAGGKLRWSPGGVRCAARGAAVAVDGSAIFCSFQVYIVAGGRFGRFTYQLVEKTGWDLGVSFPFWESRLPDGLGSGGFFSLLGISSPGELGCC